MRQPPRFLRHFISWRLLGWINKRQPTCWASMVTWKMFGESDWYNRHSCWDGTGEGFDWCGRWESKEAFDDARLPR